MRKLKCMMVYELYYFVPGVICFSFFSDFPFYEPLVEQKLLTLPEHLSSPPFLMGFVVLDL
jgi:hypothetical protein